MNSTWRGLRPTVGLRRPGRCLLRRRRPTPGAERLRRPISIDGRAFGRWSACADREGVFCVGEGRRPARSARRGRFQSAGKPSADGRPAPTEKDILCVGGGRRLARSAWRGRFQSTGKSSADGRPAPTGKVSSASAEADARRAAPGEAGFNRCESLRPMVGLRRPKRHSLRRRRPTLGAKRLGRPISIGVKRPMVGLRRPGRCLLRRRRPTLGAERPERPISIAGEPSAIGRPAPTEKDILCVGGGRRLARSA
jgi:hypothetical protein